MPLYTYLHNPRVDIHFQSWSLMSAIDKGVELNSTLKPLSCIQQLSRRQAQFQTQDMIVCMWSNTTSIRVLRSHPKSIKNNTNHSIIVLDLQILQLHRTSFQWCKSSTQGIYPCRAKTYFFTHCSTLRLPHRIANLCAFEP